jgi:hypothetical protein
VIGNYHFLHLENSGSGGTVEDNLFECTGGGLVSFYFKDSSAVTIQRNAFTGSVFAAGIVLDGRSSHGIVVANDMSKLNAGGAHIVVRPECHGNLFARNVIGPLVSGTGETVINTPIGPVRVAGISCGGDHNDFIRNDYTQSGITGLTAGGVPCVALTNTYDPDTGDLVAEPEDNLVFEADGLPAGTTATEQVLDDPRELTGTTTNTVVGH